MKILLVFLLCFTQVFAADLVSELEVTNDEGNTLGVTGSTNDVVRSTRASEVTAAAILSDTTSIDAKVCTEAKQDSAISLLTTIDADTSLIDVLLSTRASEATASSIDTKLTTTNNLLTTIDADTSSLDTKFDVNLSTRATEATLSTLNNKVTSAASTSDAVPTADLGILDRALNYAFNGTTWERVRSGSIGDDIVGAVGMMATNLFAPVNEVPAFTERLTDSTMSRLRMNRHGGLYTTLQDYQTSSTAFILPNGVVNTSEIIRLTGGNFGSISTLLPHDWRTSVVGSGTASVVDGELDLSTGTTANSSVAVDSFKKAPFSAATFNLSHLAFRVASPFNADVIRRFGVYEPNSTPVNGMFFEFLNGDGVSSVDVNLVRVKNGVEEERIVEASFNGGNALVKDDNIHIYETIYNAGTIYWLQDRKLIHRSGSPVSAAFQSPDLRVGMYVENINGNTTDNLLITRGAAVSRIGVNNSIPRYFHINATGTYVIKQSSGKLISVVVNDKGSGASSIDLYNNPAAAAGDIIANVDSSDVQGTVPYGTTFDSGLTVNVAGGNVNVTVVYE